MPLPLKKSLYFETCIRRNFISFVKYCLQHHISMSDGYKAVLWKTWTQYEDYSWSPASLSACMRGRNSPHHQVAVDWIGQSQRGSLRTASLTGEFHCRFYMLSPWKSCRQGPTGASGAGQTRKTMATGSHKYGPDTDGESGPSDTVTSWERWHILPQWLKYENKLKYSLLFFFWFQTLCFAKLS